VKRPRILLVVLAIATPAASQLQNAPLRDDPMGRYRATRDGATMDEWVRRLQDPSPETRLAAVKSMGDSGDPQAVQHLIGAVLDSDSRVSTRAVDALGRLRATAATDFLTQQLFLKRTAGPLRQQILVALGRIGDSEASRPIVEFLNQADDHELRASGIFALGEIGDTTVEADVSRMAEHETDPQLRKLAQEALGKISGRRFEPTPVPTGIMNPLLRPLDP
jgi:HEAT repeat protein